MTEPEAPTMILVRYRLPHPEAFHGEVSGRVYEFPSCLSGGNVKPVDARDWPALAQLRRRRCCGRQPEAIFEPV